MDSFIEWVLYSPGHLFLVAGVLWLLCLRFIIWSDARAKNKVLKEEETKQQNEAEYQAWLRERGL